MQAYAGENVPAATSPISSPTSAAFDSTGAVYFSEQGSRRIRKILLRGHLVTVAGRGVPDPGDGGPVEESLLLDPWGIATAPDGSTYIAGQHDHRVRRAGPEAVISTIAGTGLAGFSGDGGLAVNAQLNTPNHVAPAPNGNLCIIDAGNRRVRCVRPAGVILTVAGGGKAAASGDGGPAIEAQLAGVAGYLYLSDSHRIRMVDPAGMISTLAGTGEAASSGDGGPANAAAIKQPTGLVFDAVGNLYVAAFGEKHVRKIATDGTISTVTGEGAATLDDGVADLRDVYGIAIAAAGSIYLSEYVGSRVFRLSNGALSLLVARSGPASGDGGPAADARISNPRQLAVLPNGDLLVTDAGNKRIRHLTTGAALTVAVSPLVP